MKIVKLTDLIPNGSYSIQVRGRTSDNQYTEWSSFKNFTAVADTTAPNKPKAPTVIKSDISTDNTTTWTAYISHDGLDNATGAKLAADTTLLKVYVREGSGGSSTQIGELQISQATGIIYGKVFTVSKTTYTNPYFSVKAVDKSGNISEESNAVSPSATANFSKAYISDLTADKITTGTLSASTSITVGTSNPIIISSSASTPLIRAGQTAYNTGTGFWMGYDTTGTSAYKFSIGNSSGNKLTWSGTDLSITGSITATSGKIGTSPAWYIGDTTYVGTPHGVIQTFPLSQSLPTYSISGGINGVELDSEGYLEFYYQKGTANAFYKTKIGGSTGFGTYTSTGTLASSIPPSDKITFRQINAGTDTLTDTYVEISGTSGSIGNTPTVDDGTFRVRTSTAGLIFDSNQIQAATSSSWTNLYLNDKGGNIYIYGNLYTANTSALSTPSNNINIKTGDASGSTSPSGDISVQSGNSTSGDYGSISIGTANNAGIDIGNYGILTLKGFEINLGVNAGANTLNVGSSNTTTVVNGTKTFVGDTYFNNGTYNGVLMQGIGGIELGRQDGTSSAAFIDFHTSTTAVDWDARIISAASTGTNVIGGGQLQIFAKTIQISSPITTDDSSMQIANTATASGSTKAIIIGTNSVSGSTTNITLGTSATGGALGTTTINGVTINIGNNSATSMTLGGGTVTQTVNIASGGTASGNTKTVNIGNGGTSGSTVTMNIGSPSASTSTIDFGPVFASAGSSSNTIDIGKATGAGTITNTIRIGSATAAGTTTSITIGANNGTSSTTIQGSLTATGNAGNAISLTTGTTGALTLDTGTTGAISIGTNANAKTITIGNSTGATTLNLTAGSGGVVVTGTLSATSASLTTPTINTINASGTTTAALLWDTVITSGSISMGSALTIGSVNIANGTVFNGTVNIGSGSAGSSKNINIGNAATGGTTTIVIGNVASGGTASITIGSSAGTSTTTINGSLTTTGNIAINNGTSTAITTTGTTAAIFNTNATTVNIAGAATTLAIGASTGTTTINNTLKTAAGTLTLAPISITNGTNKTTSVAGDIEYDGTQLYFTPASSGAGRGVVPALHMARRDVDGSSTAGVNGYTTSGTVVAIFKNGNKTLTVEANTVYYFKIWMPFTTAVASTGVTLAFNMAFNTGTPTIKYRYLHHSSTSSTQNSAYVTATSNSSSTAVTPSITTAVTNLVEIEGYFITGTGTNAFTPGIANTGTVAAGNSITALADTYMTVQKIGSSSTTLIAGAFSA